MNPLLAASKIEHHFGRARVLRGLSFAVNPGEVVGIVGPGGVGKTVLLKVLAGLLKPTNGRVLVFGEELHRLERSQLGRLRSRMGMVFQNYALFDFLTVAENVAFPLLQDATTPRDEALARASALLAEVGLAGNEALYPRELSGGMKKRVSLARATIHEPELVLYDDSTDLIVSHDLDRLTKVCHRYLLIHEGRIHFQGTLEDAAAHKDDPVIEAFFFGAKSARMQRLLREAAP